MAEQIDVKGAVDYFRGRDEVSALYVFGIRKDVQDPQRQLGLAVLVDDDGITDGSDFLQMGSWDLSDDFPQWSMSVVLLNEAPSFIRYHIARKGSIVFERDQAQRLRFAEQAVNQYLDQVTAEVPPFTNPDFLETEIFRSPEDAEG